MNPKLEDVIAVVDALADRVEALERFAAEHRAGAVDRQRELDQLRGDQGRLAWAAKYRGRR